MSFLKQLLVGIIGLGSIAAISAANAVPINVTFSTLIVAPSNITTAPIGDTFTLSFMIESGGPGVAGTFTNSAITSSVLGSTTNGYSAEYGPLGRVFGITIDAVGNVTAANFTDTTDFSDNTDNFANSVVLLGQGGIVSSVNDTANFATQTNNVAGWTISAIQSEIPEPGMLVLFGIGLIGVYSASRYNKPVFA